MQCDVRCYLSLYIYIYIYLYLNIYVHASQISQDEYVRHVPVHSCFFHVSIYPQRTCVPLSCRNTKKKPSPLVRYDKQRDDIRKEKGIDIFTFLKKFFQIFAYICLYYGIQVPKTTCTYIYKYVHIYTKTPSRGIPIP